MKSNNYSISGVVLAGGKSIRMQSDKKNLSYNGKTFLSIAKETLKNSGCTNIYTSLAPNFNDATNNKSNIIKDTIKEIGPLSGVLSSLQQLNDDYIVFIPTDMPLLSSDTIKTLISKINEKTTGLNYKDNVFPFIVKNSNSAIDVIQKQVKLNRFSLNQFLKNINSTVIDFKDNKNYLANINYKEDYLRLNESNVK